MSAPALFPVRQLTTVREVCDAFLRDAFDGPRSPEYAPRFLALLVADKGDVAIERFTGGDLKKWVASGGEWGQVARFRAARLAKSAWAWAWSRGFIERNLLKNLNLPAAKRREPMQWDHFRKMLRGSDAAMRRLLLFAWWTGRRPFEIVAMRGEQADLEAWFPSKAVRLLAWLRARQAGEFLFVRSDGTPWTTKAISGRVARTRERIRIPSNVKLFGLHNLERNEQ